MLLVLKSNAEELGQEAARIVANAIRRNPRIRLGLATGSLTQPRDRLFVVASPDRPRRLGETSERFIQRLIQALPEKKMDSRFRGKDEPERSDV